MSYNGEEALKWLSDNGKITNYQHWNDLLGKVKYLDQVFIKWVNDVSFK